MLTCWRGALLALALTVLAAPASAQTCRHGETETEAERVRRTEALTAVHVINTEAAHAGAQNPRLPRRAPQSEPGAAYPSWEELRPFGDWKMDVGPLGIMARRLKWGTPEPLPGWRIHFVSNGEAYAFSLRDTTDPCGFTFWSDDSGVIRTGTPLPPPSRQVVR